LNKHGFTLVELLVAALIFLIATVAFGFALNTGKNSIESAARLSRATYLLQSKMEEIRALPFSVILPLNGRSFAGGKGKISVTPALADLASIKLELDWDSGKLPLKFYSLKSKYD
jgi:prepilin-type N-terminal cleavage/methylation domain-containing protein